MKAFCGGANPNTGAPDRLEDTEEYDYHQEIARYQLTLAPSRRCGRALGCCVCGFPAVVELSTGWILEDEHHVLLICDICT